MDSAEVAADVIVLAALAVLLVAVVLVRLKGGKIVAVEMKGRSPIGGGWELMIIG
jgi:hypothetical protein